MNSNIKLLIIEDNPEECKILKNFFNNCEKIGTCKTASDGMQAIDAIKFEMPDIVLSDFVIPKVDGLAILKYIKKMPGKLKPKVIMFSAIDDKKIINSFFEFGADYFVKKPVDFQFLLETLFNVYNEKISNCDFETTTDNLVKKTKNILNLIGMPINLKGYKYIIEVITAMVANEDSVLHKKIYQEIGDRKFVSPDAIDVSITNAVKCVHKINNNYYRKIFNYFSFNKKPKNSIFLNTIKELALSS